jgi:ATP-binding cassette subfamily F protein uup
VETLDLLEEMVANYAGTLLLVSHDRAFLDNVVTSTLVFEGGGQVNEYVGGYSDWLRQRKTAPAAAAPIAAETAPSAAAPGGKPRRLSYKEQREQSHAGKIQNLSRAGRAAGKSRTGAIQDGSGGRQRCLTRLQCLNVELEAAYARWDVLES